MPECLYVRQGHMAIRKARQGKTDDGTNQETPISSMLKDVKQVL